FSISSATRCSAAARSNAVSAAQPPAARFAAPMASRASSRPPCGTSPIVSPVAGDSAANVSPEREVVHAPSRNITPLDATGALVVDDDPHQIADRDDPDGLVSLEHRQ